MRRIVSLMAVVLVMVGCASKTPMPENLVQAQAMTDGNLAHATEQSVMVQDAKQAVISADKAKKQSDKAQKDALKAQKKAQKAEKKAQKAQKRAEARSQKAQKRAKAEAEKLAQVDEMLKQ